MALYNNPETHNLRSLYINNNLSNDFSASKYATNVHFFLDNLFCIMLVNVNMCFGIGLMIVVRHLFGMNAFRKLTLKKHF